MMEAERKHMKKTLG